MKTRSVGAIGLVATALVLAVGAAAQAPAGGSWFFALSGDSRDCGDLIMPKIAHDIEANRATTPVEFYWHLGDFRRMYDIDCDVLLAAHPAFDCRSPRKDALSPDDMNEYLDRAWDDFLARQIGPFGATQVFLGIGNHELYLPRTRAEFRQKFQRWLTQEPLHSQRVADTARGLRSDEGETFYHFVKHGVDFIYLDNADPTEFTNAQIVWLAGVLALDAKDAGIRAIIVGMHEALPYSTVRDHAMDASCQGLCSGRQVYDMLYQAQGLSGPTESQKHVYVFASHYHLYGENAYDTPEHRGQVVPGWIVGTAGAEQYVSTIRYGYVRVEVRPDGSILPLFREVRRDSPPLAGGAGAANLTEFCFAFNKREYRASATAGPPCACGASR
jgi:hypothetical protein